MDHITVRHIVEAVSGTLLCGDADTELKHISIDSRSMRGADLFVPLIGEKSDAHRFLVQAMDNGAAAALTSEHEAAPEGFHGALIQVKDTKLALQTIGRCLRARLSIPLVGITGSVGKTTTREMVAAALSAKYKTFKTPANHNSQIGVPLTISEISENDEIGVLELGMSEPGEMAVIAEIAAVDSAVMTNIGVTHIENLGSRENILKENLHIQDGMKAGGILFVNGDNDMLSTVHAKAGCHTVRYGLGADNDYRAEDLSYPDGFPSFTMVHGEVRVPVKLTVMGEHNVMNALAALAVADAYGVPLADAAEKLLEFGGFKNRQQIYHKNGYTIVDDTYNASPDSITSNLHALFDYPGNGRRIAVLADVLELGKDSGKLHEGIGQFIIEEQNKGRRLDYLFTVGKEAAHISDYVKAHSDIPVFSAESKDEVMKELETKLQKEDWVLVKGSRGMKMDEVVKRLIKE